MDLSKLPRLSQSQNPPPAKADAPVDSTPATPPPLPSPPSSPAAAREQVSEKVVYVEQSTPGGPEAWISIAMGLLFLLMVPHALSYASSKIFHTTFAPWPDATRPFPAKCDFKIFEDGTKIYYRDDPQFWNDLVVTCFAVTLVIDGIVMAFIRKKTIVAVALVLTILVALLNLGYLLKTFSTTGLAMLSAVAVAYGGYIAIFQWQLLMSLRTKKST